MHNYTINPPIDAAQLHLSPKTSKRKEVICAIKLNPPNTPGSALAFAEAVANTHELYNNSILRNIKTAQRDRLPEAFNKAEEEVISELRARFGEKAITSYFHVDTLMTANEHMEFIKPLAEKANAKGRTIDASDVKDAIREKCIRGAALKVLMTTFDEIAKECNAGRTSYSMAYSLASQNPAILDDIIACKTPDEAHNAALKYKDVIRARIQLKIDADNARNALPAKAAKMIADATNLSIEYVTARLKTYKLLDKALDVVSDITTGKIDGCDKPGFDIDAQFKGVLDNFVQSRIAILKEIDEIEGMSEKLRLQWKEHALSTYKAEKLHPSKIHKLVDCGHFSDKQLSDALDIKDTASAAEKICSYMGSVNAHFVELFGAEEWEDMGDDERDPVLRFALLAVIDKNPAIAEKFLARDEELMNAINDEFNRDDFVAQGHGRKIVEGLHALLVGDNNLDAG